MKDPNLAPRTTMHLFLLQALRNGSSKFRMGISLFVPVFAWLAILGTTSCGPTDDQLEGPDDIFLITVDTLRADHVGFLGYPDDTTPFLSSLADRSAVFTNAYSSASHTTPSHASLFTSKYPAQHGAMENGMHVNEGVPTMATLFRERGYRTAAFTSVRFLKTLKTGFELFDAHDPEKGRYRPAHQTYEAATGWLSEQQSGQPVFVWVHLFDVHEWNKPKPRENVWLKTLRVDSTLEEKDRRAFFRDHHGMDVDAFESPYGLKKAVNSYDRRILFIDQQTEIFFKSATALQRDLDSLWIFTADHGEGLYSHGYQGHGMHLYREQLHVPLLIYSSRGLGSGVRSDRHVRHLDLLPTLAEHVQLSTSRLEGQSFLTLLKAKKSAFGDHVSFAQRRPVSQELLDDGWNPETLHTAFDQNYKYIRHSDLEDEFYDLRSDPLELDNRIEGSSTELERLKQSLTDHLERIGEGSVDGSSVTEETREELRALGYVE